MSHARCVEPRRGSVCFGAVAIAAGVAAALTCAAAPVSAAPVPVAPVPVAPVTATPIPVTPPAAAGPAAPEESEPEPGAGVFEAEVRDGLSQSYWVVGPTLEYFASAATDALSRGNDLVGVSGMWRLRGFGPHLLLLAKPSVTRFSDARFLAGLGLRGFVDIPGFTEISFGVGAHAEARLADHFWLGYLTPLELGGVIWTQGSWQMEFFIGMRRAFAGKLINFYLIDPNGFNSREAQAELDDTRKTWRAFTRIVFGRRID